MNLLMTAARAPAGTFLTPNIDLVPARADSGSSARQNTIWGSNGVNSAAAASRRCHRRHREVDIGLYRDENILLSLQLLACFSKYLHYRQAFYKPCLSFHPTTAWLSEGRLVRIVLPCR